MSRALRRHHAERVRARFRRVYRGQRSVNDFATVWEWHREPDGSLVGRSVAYLDGAEAREQWVERVVRHRAEHPACSCGVCRHPRYDREEARRERERLLHE